MFAQAGDGLLRSLKIDLAVEFFGSRPRLDALVRSVRQQDASVHAVAQVSVESFLHQVCFQAGVVDRTDDFDPTIQIARHPVRAADVNLFITVVREVADAAVLKEAPDDTAHADIL